MISGSLAVRISGYLRLFSFYLGLGFGQVHHPPPKKKGNQKDTAELLGIVPKKDATF